MEIMIVAWFVAKVATVAAPLVIATSAISHASAAPTSVPQAIVNQIDVQKLIAENTQLKRQQQMPILTHLEKQVGPLKELRPALHALAGIIALYGLYKVGQGLYKLQQVCFDDPQSLEEESSIKGFIKSIAIVGVGASNMLAGACIPLLLKIIEEYAGMSQQ